MKETQILTALADRLALYTTAEGHPDDAGLWVSEGPLTLSPEDTRPRLIYSAGALEALEQSHKKTRVDFRLRMSLDIEHHTPLDPDLSPSAFRDAQRARLDALLSLIFADPTLGGTVHNLTYASRTLHPREPGSVLAVQTLSLYAYFVDSVGV
jgi:hypothetical protein